MSSTSVIQFPGTWHPPKPTHKIDWSKAKRMKRVNEKLIEVDAIWKPKKDPT